MAWVDMGGGQWNWVGEVPSIIPELPALDFLATALPTPPAVPVSPLEKATSPGVPTTLQSLKDIYMATYPTAATPTTAGNGDSSLGLLVLLGLGGLFLSRMRPLRL